MFDADGRNAIRSAGRLGAIGIEFAASVIGCLLLGYWLDGHFHTSPWCTLTGIIVGSAAGFFAMIRAVQAANRTRRDGSGESDAGDGGGGGGAA